MLLADSIYETVYYVAKDTSTNFWWYSFVTLVEFAQLMAFPIQLLVATAPYAEEVELFLDNFLVWTGLTGNSFDSISGSLGLAVYVGTLAWIILFIGFTIFAGYYSWYETQELHCILSFSLWSGDLVWIYSSNNSQMPSFVRYLRTIAHLSSTILFIPIISVLFQTYRCNSNGGWVIDSSFTCYGGAHIGMTLVVPLLLPAYSVLCLFTVAVAFKRNIRSTELGAKVHGKWWWKLTLLFLYMLGVLRCR